MLERYVEGGVIKMFSLAIHRVHFFVQSGAADANEAFG